MRILHIDETFHPSFGYQLNSLSKYEAKAGNEVYIITSCYEKLHPAFSFTKDNKRLMEYDEAFAKQNNVSIIRTEVKKFISGRAIYNLKKLFKKIDEISPDVVMVHQVETFAAIMYILKGYYKKYPTVFDSHMLSMATANKYVKIYNFLYKIFVTSKINKNQLKVVRTQQDNYVIKTLGISEKYSPFISFGTDLMLFSSNEVSRKEFRKQNNISQDAFVVVYTGKMDKAKGGLLLAEALKKKFEIKNGREIVFVVVGNIYDNEYGNKVKELFENSENRVIRFPTQKYVDLPKFYQAADLNVYAKQCSLSFYDAQACGLPVVSEDNNINVERNSNGNGLCFKSGDVDDFREKIDYFYSLSNQEYLQYSENAVKYIVENFNYADISAKYDEYLKLAITKFNNKKNKENVK